MAEAEPGLGNVAIELDGKELELVPSLKACIDISSMAGGLNAAVQRCVQLDFNTVCAVIVAGLGLNPVQAKQVPEAVYRTGVIRLFPKCIEFITNVGNGGQPPEDEEQDQTDQDPPRPASP